MKQQTKNFIELCKGGNPATILSLLQFQSKQVLDDLYSIYNTTDKREISVKLSNGL